MKALLASLFLVVGIVSSSLFTNPSVSAIGLSEGIEATQGTETNSAKKLDQACLFTGAKVILPGSKTPQTCKSGFVSTIINILLFIIGAVAVIMIIYGGIRYVISGGDSSQVTGAKNTIIYAVVGLIVAILAYAIVNFVIGGLMSTTTA